MKLSKSFIGLVTVSTIFMLYASGLYTNFQSDSALEIVDFSIDKPAGEKNIHQIQIVYLFMETCMFIPNILLMHIFLE